ncbi:YegP family protein [Aquimarina sp. U1-2]|uniref:YegP family protein n=1 Tax=Aquimarina sp. U1-2 TaxID=2823141 RepID=UPI001AECE0F9|nr:YegP family protein [Aquimarina sp. U1-2]
MKIHKSNNGEYYFNLHASNNQIIATGETYTTKQGCENGIESVKTNAPIAEIEDVTNE